MELKLIKQQTCDCGAATVEESCRHVHCNGQGFERRTFACGRILAWSPNFGRLEEERQCPKDPIVIAQVMERTNMEKMLFDTIRGAAIHRDAKYYWHKKISWNTRQYADHDFRKKDGNE